jgi:hypothetical protein
MANKNLLDVTPLADGPDVLPGSFFPEIMIRRNIKIIHKIKITLILIFDKAYHSFLEHLEQLPDRNMAKLHELVTTKR